MLRLYCEECQEETRPTFDDLENVIKCSECDGEYSEEELKKLL